MNDVTLKEKNRAYYKKNKDLIKARSIARYQKMKEDDPGKAREIARRSNLRKYNITLEEYEQLLKEQGGVCYLCGQPPEAERNLSIDHNHECCAGNHSCGLCIRGLAHLKCNTIIAYANDDPALLRRLALVLEQRQESHNEG